MLIKLSKEAYRILAIFIFLNLWSTDNIQAESLKRDNFDPFIIPEDEYFVMGDNRDNSSDSRYWGTVKRHQIIGKPMFVYWSWNGKIPAWKLFHKLLSIRLGRIGKIIE